MHGNGQSRKVPVCSATQPLFAAAIIREIAAKGAGSRFTKTDRGLFAFGKAG